MCGTQRVRTHIATLVPSPRLHTVHALHAWCAPFSNENTCVRTYALYVLLAEYLPYSPLIPAPYCFLGLSHTRFTDMHVGEVFPPSYRYFSLNRLVHPQPPTRC